MSRTITPATFRDEISVRVALERLREARDLLLEAGAHKAADKVRLAIASTEGARRHVIARQHRTTEIAA